MVEQVDRDSRGILAPAVGLRRFDLVRHAPSPAVGRFVDRYWVAAWDLPPGEVHTQEVLPHPVVNVILGDGEPRVGLTSTLFTRRIEGTGAVLGIMFRPGGFRPLLGRPMAALADVTVPLADVVGPGPAAALDAAATDPAAVDAVLAGLLPTEPHPCEATSALVEKAAADPSLCRVEDLAARAGLGTRTLQRRFADHVGFGPKQVLRRYRLYDAAERARLGDAVDWAAVAAELAYADQSHLTNDFTAAFGVSPAAYVRRCRDGR